MVIRIDTREQAPLAFHIQGVECVVGTVPVFDYALDGDQDKHAVERKSLHDFISSVVMRDGYRRELAKIERARAAGMRRIHYVIEADYQDVARYDFARFPRGVVTAGFVYRRWRELAHDHNVNVVWAGNDKGAAWAVYLLLKSRAEELARGVAS